MRKSMLLAALLPLIVASAARAQSPTYMMSPQSGSAAGGTQVTLKAPNAAVATSVYFGTILVAATRVDATTLTVTTPARLPGTTSRTVPVKLWIFGAAVDTGLTFTYADDAEKVFERLLLPVFTAPVTGAFGSEFRTEFHATLASGASASIFGLARQCIVGCVEGPDAAYLLTSAAPDLDPARIKPIGTPGQFLYVAKSEVGLLAMNLRAYDTSRSSENFGTEIPIVRESEFRNQTQSLTLAGIPSDTRFRKTLRIYSLGDPRPFGLNIGAVLNVSIQGTGVDVTHVMGMDPNPDSLHPAYIEFSNFPVAAGMLRMTISVAPHYTSDVQPFNFWAFVTVTNNSTQHITTITPQP